MKKLNDKKQVVAQISAAARLYKKNLVGKHFLYVFDGRAIEVAYLDEGESIDTLPPLAAELVRLTDEAGT